jgi:hypothetical protein
VGCRILLRAAQKLVSPEIATDQWIVANRLINKNKTRILCLARFLRQGS